jgi:hypothetical protein
MEVEMKLIAEFKMPYQPIAAAWAAVDKMLGKKVLFRFAISMMRSKVVVQVAGEAHEIMMLIGAVADQGEDGLVSVKQQSGE